MNCISTDRRLGRNKGGPRRRGGGWGLGRGPRNRYGGAARQVWGHALVKLGDWPATSLEVDLLLAEVINGLYQDGAPTARAVDAAAALGRLAPSLKRSLRTN